MDAPCARYDSTTPGPLPSLCYIDHTKCRRMECSEGVEQEAVAAVKRVTARVRTHIVKVHGLDRAIEAANITRHGVVCSMSRSGNVWDNAAMESSFSSLKTERMARKTYRTREDAKADVFDYIEHSR
jgi:integrase-like protein